jgi:hypothetical protein
MGLFAVAGCGGGGSGGKCGGGPVTGAMDTHCDGMPVVTVIPSECNQMLPATDGGMDSGDDFGDTMFNSSGKDDDCKYAVSFKVDKVCENSPTSTFTVQASQLADNMPVTCEVANVRAEVFLTADHLSPSIPKVASPSAGTYVISGVEFNASGMWTVRFHFCENCTDFPDGTSPHGHAAFYINVP